MSDFTNAFTFVGNNVHLLFHLSMSLLSLAGISVAISIVIAVPLGVFLGHVHRGSFIAINGSNFGRALPSLAVLAILLPFLGIGRTDVIIALVVLAVPPILTNTYTAVEQVDADAVEAAKGMGMTGAEIIRRVEVPLALPLIFAGIRTAAVFVISTATLAGDFGGGGLGQIIFNEPGYKLTGVIGASYVLILLALLGQVVFKVIEYSVTPRGLRKQPRRARLGASDPMVVLADAA